ncbi:MAG: sulfotransferase [Chromatiales bacterium]|nr:sulfotransferase [Chromatiales bacterium]
MSQRSRHHLHRSTNGADASDGSNEKSGNTPCSMIFVTGASRSGTSMLARLLGEHKEILALQETHYFGDLCDPDEAKALKSDEQLEQLSAILLARQNRGLWDSKPNASEQQQARQLVSSLPSNARSAGEVFSATLNHLATASGKSIGLEQTPRNIFYAEQLLALYPKARIVHIVRDPRAVLASQRNRWRMRQLGAGHIPSFEMLRTWVNYHPVTMSKLWSEANQQALRLLHRKHFLLVRFEDLVDAPQKEIQRICDFLDITFDPMMLDVPRWGSSNITHSTSQRGISHEVRDLWQGCLPVGDRILCEWLTRPTMKRFGYHPLPAGRADRLQSWAKILTYPLHMVGVISLNPKRAWTLLKALSIAGATRSSPPKTKSYLPPSG